ncbi:endoplasmic reticulum vesicle transporter-domain-containing protein [Pyronema domesticum]|uniref:Endoplasmic reticulum-Golgi intermediate compartment protein n=1 Tax=Pyronema omphalodes (strain CBS 100304) TaxID=1076935 RepID=U4LMH1_PYROM|nr:endoplasmic reticulum vesicle transporter-domain-containing protein [Pyronema domesticum]CCX33148.1 Similar to ER-derived vesicles protein 41; acc. no. O94283 [Pyronema omphalodes CBS 100304]
MALNDADFGDKNSGLRSFDAFPKTRKTYKISSSRGGVLTILLSLLSIYLIYYELNHHLDGAETQSFLVEHAVGHYMQINLDITVAMPCEALHINVQDAALDHILAGDILTKDPTSFDDTNAHRLVHLPGREEHVYDILGKARKSKFGKTSRKPFAFLRKLDTGSCRIYGSMNVNKVQGDFHITAAGHGYAGAHIDHSTFNFSHVVNELSFGEYYPKLVNPLDDVAAVTEHNFFKFQYYLSVVPTNYYSENSGRLLRTNQYAVTEHSREVSPYQVPGVFFKFDIEPLSLTIRERRMSFTRFLVRVVNIVGGVMVGGNWAMRLVETIVGCWGKRKRTMDGVIGGGGGYSSEKRI